MADIGVQRRRVQFPRELRAPIALLLMTSCAAFYAASWNRTQARRVTESDALMVLASAHDDAEREQALGVVARRAREFVDAMVTQAAGTDKQAEYARVHLRNIEEKLRTDINAMPPEKR